MRLRFKVQRYQTEAVDSVVDCFAGQPRLDAVGGVNAEIVLSPAQLLRNIRAVQRHRGLPLSPALARSPAAAYAEEQRLLARAEANTFARRVEQYQRLRTSNPGYLNGLWWDEMSRLYARMRETGRIDLLDQWLATDGFDILQMPLIPKKN